MARWIAANHERKLILFFNSKCACTSIKHWFNLTLAAPENNIEADIPRHLVPLDALDRYRDYRWILFVRQPLPRLVSFYAHWVIRRPGEWCHADRGGRVRLEGRTFREFIHTLRQLWLDGVPFQSHLRPQTRDIGGLEFDHVVPVERFDAEMERVCGLLGAPRPERRYTVTRYAAPGGDFAADASPQSLRNGRVPCVEAFFDQELRSMATEIYQDDADFYARHCAGGDA